MSAHISEDGPGTVPPGNALSPVATKPIPKPPALLQQVYQFLSIGALAMASYFVISHFVLQSVQVVGESMVPTLQDSQQYLLDRWVYYFRAPKRSDVVGIRDPVDE